MNSNAPTRGPRYPLGLLDRRSFLGKTSTGLSSVALTSLLQQDQLLAEDKPKIDSRQPHAPRPGHFRPQAKNVLVIFCAGACSQLETWDYKPELIKQDGKPLEGGPPVTFQGPAGNLARPQYAFRPRGESGKMVSDMLPHLEQVQHAWSRRKLPLHWIYSGWISQHGRVAQVRSGLGESRLARLCSHPRPKRSPTSQRE